MDFMTLLPHFDSKIKIPHYVDETRGVNNLARTLLSYTTWDRDAIHHSSINLLVNSPTQYYKCWYIECSLHNQISNKTLIYKFLTNNVWNIQEIPHAFVLICHFFLPHWSTCRKACIVSLPCFWGCTLSWQMVGVVYFMLVFTILVFVWNHLQ